MRWAVQAPWLAVLGLAAAACRKPPPPDPAEAAYRHAVELFAKASADTHDLTYRDSRFDAVLDALAEVPSGDELRPKAEALAQQILVARRQAAAADQASDEQVARALSDPSFVARPRDAPFPAAAPGAGATSGAAGAPAWRGTSWTGSTPSGGQQLPDWYRQAGYLGLRPRAAPAAAAVAPAPGPRIAVPPVIAPSRPPPPGSVQPAAPPPAPAVFGLPGPAGRALMGRP